MHKRSSFFFFFLFSFLLNLQIQRFIPASLLAFVHFVSGFNARGLNCCCGNHCLCFLLPPIVPWHNRLLSNNMRGSSLAFSEKWTAAGSGHLVCLRKQWHNMVFCLGKSALNSLSSFLKMRTRRSYLEEPQNRERKHCAVIEHNKCEHVFLFSANKGETAENQRTKKKNTLNTFGKVALECKDNLGNNNVWRK